VRTELDGIRQQAGGAENGERALETVPTRLALSAVKAMPNYLAGERKFISDKAPAITVQRTKMRLCIESDKERRKPSASR